MSNGISFFPLDVHMDDGIALIEAEFGLTGFAVIVKLYQKIYGGLGYYCEWTNDVACCSPVGRVALPCLK